MSNVLRTAEERFRDLPGFPFQPRYLEIGGMRAHYLDEGPRDARHVFLCLHGEPTWSYLYRKMIPVFTAAGHRAVAPDFFGFGRSDKPADESTYTFDFHREFLIAFVKNLDLKRITLVVQDWGGLLGLTLPMDLPGRFERLLLMNTALATGDVSLGPGFLAWRDYVAKNPDLSCAKLLQRTCPQLSAAEAAAYDAPFPDASYKAGVRRFPPMVPDQIDSPGAAISRRARGFWQTTWSGQSFLALGETDPVLGPPAMALMQKLIKGAPQPWVHAKAGHFVQEWGDEVARAALQAFG